MKQFLKAADIARLLDVDKSTVSRWLQQGKFKNVARQAGTGHYRIPLSSYEEFLKVSKIK